MIARSCLLLAGIAMLAGCNAAEQTKVAESTNEASVSESPEREAWFGELHLHTTLSLDAYLMAGVRLGPEDAYRFARGDTIDYLGEPVRRKDPLDFMAVTDHAENMGVYNQLDDPGSVLSQSEYGRSLKDIYGLSALMRVAQWALGGNKVPGDTSAPMAAAWAREIAAANAAYQPGKFTTFIAYEWSPTPGGANLHRNIIFAGDSAPMPFSSNDSVNPEALWAYIERSRAAGHDALAISHNANASNGLMYDWNRYDGRPIDEAYAQLRATNEPLAEITQNKGTSEAHPLLSPNDEFAGFELFDTFLFGGKPSQPGGSYWRDALGRGLVLGDRLGTNPFKDGAAGASDLHGAMSVQAEADNGDQTHAYLGGFRMTREKIEGILGHRERTDDPQLKDRILSPGSLTGVWAESNTREAIFAAFRRKETFATSGTRIRLRFFGGWTFASGLTDKVGWVREAYRTGSPMGGDLTADSGKGAPTFAIEAVKDPASGNLDRVQVVKVWLDQGKYRERVYDVTWSGMRQIDSKSGKLPAVGDTVDLKTGRYTNSIGAARLATVWRDPHFAPGQAAVYYLRALEIPTPRWTTLRAIEFGLPLPKDVPATIQERAWSSPIWYTPTKKSTARYSPKRSL